MTLGQSGNAASPLWHNRPIEQKAKRPRGRPKNVPHATPAEIEAAALQSTGRYQLMSATGISEQDAETVRRLMNKTAEEFAEEHRSRLQSLAEKLAKQAEEHIEKLSPMQTVISLGVVSDKLNQAPKTLNQALHLHIKGDASGALKAILGPAAQSVFAQPGNPDNMSDSLKIKPLPGDLPADTMREDSKSPAPKQ